MDLLPWIAIGSWLLLALGLARRHPKLFAPHCPICSEPLEADENEDQNEPGDGNWQIGWRKFQCERCWYQGCYISIFRQAKVKPV